VLCYLWIGLDEVAAVSAVAINKIPMVTAMVREGARALDPALDDMARVFRMGRTARLRHVVVPQLAPHIAAAARSGIALIWKIVLVVEFLGRSSGIGFKIHLHFQMFDVTMVLVYALAFVAVMLAIETLLLQPVEARARAWRTA
jgi:NitT/TauT family transport system permease protein